MNGKAPMVICNIKGWHSFPRFPVTRPFSVLFFIQSLPASTQQINLGWTPPPMPLPWWPLGRYEDSFKLEKWAFAMLTTFSNDLWKSQFTSSPQSLQHIFPQWIITEADFAAWMEFKVLYNIQLWHAINVFQNSTILFGYDPYHSYRG